MAWLEAHQSLATHRKLYDLADRLKVSRATAAGHLLFLWFWALDNAPDGSLEGISLQMIKDAAAWPRKADAFVHELIDAGWIDDVDGSLSLHDWMVYAGRLMERRAVDSGRKSSMRRAYADGTLAAVKRRDGDICRYCGREVDWTDRKTKLGATYDHVVYDGPTTIENLVVSCRGCNSRKAQRSPWDAGMSLNPAPDKSSDHQTHSSNNPTVPTVPTVPPPAAAAGATEDRLVLCIRALDNLTGRLNATPTVQRQIQEWLDAFEVVGQNPAEWFAAACEEAARQDVRKLAYVSGVLDHWQRPNHGLRCQCGKKRNDSAPSATQADALADEFAEVARRMR